MFARVHSQQLLWISGYFHGRLCAFFLLENWLIRRKSTAFDCKRLVRIGISPFQRKIAAQMRLIEGVLKYSVGRSLRINEGVSQHKLVTLKVLILLRKFTPLLGETNLLSIHPLLKSTKLLNKANSDFEIWTPRIQKF